MNFIDYALRDIPSNLHKNIGTVYTDIAMANGTSTGTVTAFSAPIVSGSTKSAIVGSAGANSYGFADANFVTGNEQKNFTLAIAALPASLTQEVGLMSHQNSTAPIDGLVISKDYIFFRVRFGAGLVEARYEYDDLPDAFLIHGVYTPNIIKLFVNGILVASTEVPDTYPASGFNTSSGNGTLYAGKGTGTNDKVMIDVPATYPIALREDQISRQYQALVDVVPAYLNVGSLGGVFRDGVQRRISEQKTFATADTWTPVSFTDVGWATGELIPTVDQTTGASKAGMWIGQYVIDNPDIGGTMSGIKLEWNGNGSYTVQTSLDGGTTWNSVSNGELVPTSQGLNPSGKMLLVRITFTGGVVDDVSEVKNLTITTYADNNIYTMGNDARKIVINGNVSTSLVSNQPIERNVRSGIHAYGGTLTMSQDTDASPVSIQTLEFWVNPKGVTSGAGGYVFDTRPYGGTAYLWLSEATGQWNWVGGTVYINGQAATSPVNASKFEDQHIVFVFASSFNTAINLAGGLQIADYALIANYPTALTAQQVAQLYANYSAMPVMAATEVGTVTFTELANPYVFTVADWANLPQQ